MRRVLSSDWSFSFGAALFFLEHIDSDVTETGQAALNGAIQACMPLRPAP